MIKILDWCICFLCGLAGVVCGAAVNGCVAHFNGIERENQELKAALSDARVQFLENQLEGKNENGK